LTEHDARAWVARGATYIFVQGLANSVLGLIYFIVLTRMLPDEEMGIFALLVFVLALPQVFGTLGLNTAAVKYIPQYLAQNNPEKAKSIVARLMQVCLISSAVALVLISVPAEWLSTLLFNTAEYAPLLRILGITSAFNLFYQVAACFLQALQKIRDMAILGFIYAVVQNALSIGLLYLGWRLYAVVYGWLAALSLVAIIGLIMTAKHIDLISKPHQVKPLLKYSLPLYVATGISFFVGWVDQLILVAYMSLIYGAAEAQTMLGVYYVAIRASIVPSLFSSSLITVLFPKLSELYTLQGPEGLKDAFRVSTRYAVLIGFPLIIGLATLAKPSIILFAGSKYIGAAEPLIIICAGALVATLSVAISPILLTLGRTTVVSVLSTVSVVLSLVMSYYALAFLGLGAIGTAWARSIASIIGVILTLYTVKHYVHISFDREAFWKGSLASAFMVVVIVAVDLMRSIVSPASYEFMVIRLHLLPVYIALGGVAYFVGLAALRVLKRHDLALVEGYVPKRLRRVVNWLERFTVAD